jgi:hypothetical protein
MYETIKDALLRLSDPNIIKQISDAAYSNIGETISLGFPIHVDQKNKIHFMINSTTQTQPISLANLTLAIEQILGFNDISDEREAVFVHLKIQDSQLNYIFSNIILFTSGNVPAIQQFLKNNYKEVFCELLTNASSSATASSFWPSEQPKFDPNMVVACLPLHEIEPHDIAQQLKQQLEKIGPPF